MNTIYSVMHTEHTLSPIVDIRDKKKCERSERNTSKEYEGGRTDQDPLWTSERVGGYGRAR